MGTMHDAKQQENIRIAKELWDTRQADKLARSRMQNALTEKRKADEREQAKKNR